MSDSDSDDETEAIVIDNGSCWMRSGFAGDDKPTSRVSTMIAEPMSGDESKENELSIINAMDHGIVTSADSMELLWYHVFKHELKVDPSERYILLTDSALNNKSNKETITQIMFETFNVKGMHIENQSLLSFYAMGRTSGIILTVGDGVTETIPIYEGYTIPLAIRRSDVAGSTITDYLMQLLNHKGYSFSTSIEREIVRDIKEKHAYIAMDCKSDIDKWESTVGKSDMEQKYALPDGNEISLNVERFKCAELLFTPGLFGLEEKGIHEILYETINTSDIDTRRDFYYNIILAGGTTLMHGMQERLQAELLALMQQRRTPGIRSPHARGFNRRVDSAWLGGSILASLSTFNDGGWTLQRDYNEHGPSVIHRKCRIQ